MKEKAARGGAKPQMIQSSRSMPITINNMAKGGLYELSKDGTTVARRVELPTWLSDIWTNHGCAIGVKDILRHPRPQDTINESQGQIFLNPPSRLGLGGPSVGLDVEIYHIVLSDARIMNIEFHVYATEYRLVEVLRISSDEFLDSRKLVQTSKTFMPQMMVAVNQLTVHSSNAVARHS